MKNYFDNHRVLVVTPEVSFMRHGLRPGARDITARASGLGDICAAHIHTLYEHGLDVHLAIPDYRHIFKMKAHSIPGIDIHNRQCKLPESHVHLAQDSSFYHRPKLRPTAGEENIRIALAFQREVINRIIPEVQPDLIHCYDWMTGLIPAMARCIGIPSIFTLLALDSPQLFLSTIEERGIDAAPFWRYCYYSRMPLNYQETRNTNPLDMSVSGLFAANIANMSSETFLSELTHQQSQVASPLLRVALNDKLRAGTLTVLAPAPDSSYDPSIDRSVIRAYGPESHFSGKLFNKLELQEASDLYMDSNAPLFLWPTRLDGSRPGCRLMADILATILDRYREQCLQIVFMADGDYQEHIRELIGRLHATDRVTVCDFDVRQCRLAYAGSDFVLMPMKHAPDALPCKIGQRYGALPIAYDAAAIHDCVDPLDPAANRGSGFLFKHFDATGLLWAIDQAMDFYNQSRAYRSVQVQRIMTDSLLRFNAEDTACHTIDLYARALDGCPRQLKVQTDPSGRSRIYA